MQTRPLSYSEMITYPTFLERFEYLKLSGSVGEETFGFDRYLNQRFYRSVEWRRVRNAVIARDEAMDLGVHDHPIAGKLYVHHINPITARELKHNDDALMDLDNLVCVSHATHNAIHYGDASLLPQPIVERRPGDTKLW